MRAGKNPPQGEISVTGVQRGRPKFTTCNLISDKGKRTPATPRRAASVPPSRLRHGLRRRVSGKRRLGLPSPTPAKPRRARRKRRTETPGDARRAERVAFARQTLLRQPRGPVAAPEKKRTKRTNHTPHAAHRRAAPSLASAPRRRNGSLRRGAGLITTGGNETPTLHTVAPRRRSPVRRGGATARSGVSLAR